MRTGSASEGDRWQSTYLLRWGRAVVLLLFVSAGLAVIGGVVVAGAQWGDSSAPVANSIGSDDACVDPPCLPESWPDLESLPVAAPVILSGLALILAVPLLLLGLLRAFQGSGRLLGSTGLLVFGPAIVAVGAEAIPHLVTPCWAGEISGVCVATAEHGIDYADYLHLLGHALFGWGPLAIGYWWLLRALRPELLPRR